MEFQTSFKNKKIVLKTNTVGCYCCKKIFNPSQIKKFLIEQDKEETALCPYCHLDTIVPLNNTNTDLERLNELHEEFMDE